MRLSFRFEFVCNYCLLAWPLGPPPRPVHVAAGGWLPRLPTPLGFPSGFVLVSSFNLGEVFLVVPRGRLTTTLSMTLHVQYLVQGPA